MTELLDATIRGLSLQQKTVGWWLGKLLVASSTTVQPKLAKCWIEGSVLVMRALACQRSSLLLEAQLVVCVQGAALEG